MRSSRPHRLFRWQRKPQGGGPRFRADPVVQHRSQRPPAGGSITAGALDFGILEANTPKTAEHILRVTTNAPADTALRARGTPLTSGTDEVLDTTGDDSSITERRRPWAINTTTGFGFALQNYAGSGRCLHGRIPAVRGPWADETPKQVMGNAGPVTAARSAGYKVKSAPRRSRVSTRARSPTCAPATSEGGEG